MVEQQFEKKFKAKTEAEAGVEVEVELEVEAVERLLIEFFQSSLIFIFEVHVFFEVFYFTCKELNVEGLELNLNFQ